MSELGQQTSTRGIDSKGFGAFPVVAAMLGAVGTVGMNYIIQIQKTGEPSQLGLFFIYAWEYIKQPTRLLFASVGLVWKPHVNYTLPFRELVVTALVNSAILFAAVALLCGLKWLFTSAGKR